MEIQAILTSLHFIRSELLVAEDLHQEKVQHKILKNKNIIWLTVINASAAVTLLEQRPEKIQALSGTRTHDLCDAKINFIMWLTRHKSAAIHK